MTQLSQVNNTSANSSCSEDCSPFQYIQNTLTIIFVMSDTVTTAILSLTLVLSSYSFGCIGIFSRAYFTGTILRFEAPLTTSCNKHQGLHPRYCHRLVGWNSSRCTEITTDIRDLYLKYYVVAYSVMIALSLLLICFSYLSIRKRFCKRNPVLDTGYSRKSVEQNTKLSKTIFIVIGASVALWAPSMALYNLGLLSEGLFPGFVNYIFGMFHLTNSLINPIIYSLRMPLFRKLLQQLKNKLRVPQWRSKNYAVTKTRVTYWRSTRLKRGGDGVESLISFFNNHLNYL